ncbi:unnamed protein product [Schistosoma turkestanicum]|nr:unnamed protein product [Schistosoma turkestanicum]
MTGSYNNTIKVFDRQNPIEGSYKLIMQDEDTNNTFHDLFRTTAATTTTDDNNNSSSSSVFITPIISTSSSSTSGDSGGAELLPWPRRIHDDLIDMNENLPKTSFSDNNSTNNHPNINESLFTVDVGRKWLQVSWKPWSTIAAVSHTDGIHLIEAI